MRAEDLNFEDDFDVVWACASLIHVETNQFDTALKRIISSIKRNGVFYISLKKKSGNYESESDRSFNYYDENEIKECIYRYKDTRIKKLWLTNDSKIRNITWINVIVNIC